MPDDELTDEDLEVEINLRSPREVAARLIVLGAVCRRAFLEAQPLAEPGEDPEAERFDLAAWLRTEDLDGVVTPGEARLLHTRVGRLAADEADAASWQTEALVALGWSLRMVDTLPAYDEVADPSPILQALPAPWDATRPFLAQARLRGEDEIAVERERAELWHWRAQTAEQLRVATPGDRRTLRAAVRDVAAEAHNAGLLDAPASGDFPARGRAYGDLDADTLADLGAVAFERYRALNWLCGFGVTWDDVPTDV